MCVRVCERKREREREEVTLMTTKINGGCLTILKSVIKYKNTHNEVYILESCAKVHMCE